jgi:hypothetical protein
MRLLLKWFYISLISLFLQSCCPLGGQRISTSKGSWEHVGNTTYSSVSASTQLSNCSKIKHQHCTDEYTEICSTLANGQKIKAINPSTGEDESRIANDMYKAQCAILETDPKQIENYCESGSSSDCMEENGFVYKYHDVSQCSPMKLF